jgi:hypothetical protein
MFDNQNTGGMPMITKKIWSALLLFVMLALAGCPQGTGGGGSSGSGESSSGGRSGGSSE